MKILNPDSAAKLLILRGWSRVKHGWKDNNGHFWPGLAEHIIHGVQRRSETAESWRIKIAKQERE